jgi:hypothetical protein
VPGPAAKQVKKVPKPIPVTLPLEVEISEDSATIPLEITTIPLEISSIDSTEDKPLKAKKQLNLF